MGIYVYVQLIHFVIKQKLATTTTTKRWPAMEHKCLGVQSLEYEKPCYVLPIAYYNKMGPSGFLTYQLLYL